MQTFQKFIPVCNLEWFTGKLEKRNKKLKNNPITWIEPKLVQSIDGIPCKLFQIFIPELQESGWKMLAILEPIEMDDGKQENIIRTLPNYSETLIPDQFRTYVGRCDHCCQHRVRNQTFLLVNVLTDEFKCVGRTCLQEFFIAHGLDGTKAGDRVQYLSDYANALMNIQDLVVEAIERGKSAPSHYMLKDLLRLTIVHIMDNPYVSVAYSETSNVPATSRLMWNILSGGSDSLRAERQRIMEHPRWNESEQLAEDIVEWATNLPYEKIIGSNYLGNLNTIARANYVSYQTAGLAASMIIAYRRDHGLREKGNMPDRKESVYISEPGQNIQIPVTVDSIQPVDTMFGTRYKFAMFDDAGNALIWWTVADSATKSGLNERGRYLIKAKVSAHNLWNNIKQTVLQRIVKLENLDRLDPVELQQNIKDNVKPEVKNVPTAAQLKEQEKQKQSKPVPAKKTTKKIVKNKPVEKKTTPTKKTTRKNTPTKKTTKNKTPAKKAVVKKTAKQIPTKKTTKKVIKNKRK